MFKKILNVLDYILFAAFIFGVFFGWEIYKLMGVQ
jgi:hypothetical protein